jgi:predicted nucleic acid-binding protein
VKGLLDTSVFVAREQGRPIGALPDEGAISVVTVAELHIGVLVASDDRTRALRLRTLARVERLFDPLPVDSEVARRFAELVADARRHERKPKILDALIAATAVRHELPVYTQDEDFDQFPTVRVTRV